MRPSRFGRAAFRAFWFACAAGAISYAASACNGWDPREPFEHNAPEVDEALRDLDGGQLESAEDLLERYLGTGACGDAGIGLPDAVREKPNGSFDLGLTLFNFAEKYGRRFGDEEGDAGAQQPEDGRRAAEIACALVIVKAIANDPKVPPDLRARAFYLAGNLEFLGKQYKEAVEQYDKALGIVPGLADDAGVDGLGRDAAHNRAIALRRLEDQNDAGNDGGDDGGSDGGDAGAGDGGDSGQGPSDASDDAAGNGDGGDGGDDDNPDKQNSGPDAGDAGRDAGDKGPPDAGGDAGRDAGADPEKDKGDNKQPTEPPGSDSMKSSPQDDRMLDRLEEAPSYQQQEAKSRANRRRGRTMEDK